ECSDAASLARHLGRFGEIRITRLEPETTVAWEGEHVSGTVRLESSGWGTRVTLTARGSEPAVPAIEDPFEAGSGADEDPLGAGSGADEDPLGAGPCADEESPPGAGPHADQEPPGEGAQEAAPSLAGEGSSEDASPSAATKPGFLMRLFGRRRRAPAAPPPGVQPEVEAAAEDDPVNAAPAGQDSPSHQGGSSAAVGSVDRDAVDPPAVLASALNSLGQAHHRPYSRS